MKPLVSICVPIYNVAPYIERCARSLFTQTYQNLEFVFVDDATPDNSLSILKQVLADYPERAQQVRIVQHDHNRGLAATRRTSIINATGEYIIPVDSDDYVETTMVELLVEQAITSQADIVCSAYIEHWSNHRQVLHPAYDFSRTDNHFDDLIREKLQCCLWSRLYRKELFINGQCFAPEGLNYGEDRIAQHKLFLHAKRVSSIQQVTYHYLHHEQSITANKTDYHFDCLIRYWTELNQLLDRHNLLDQYQLLCRHIRVVDKTALMLNTHSLDTRKKYADLYRQEEIYEIPTLHKGYYIMAQLVHHHAWFLIRMYQIYIDFREKSQNS